MMLLLKIMLQTIFRLIFLHDKLHGCKLEKINEQNVENHFKRYLIVVLRNVLISISCRRTVYGDGCLRVFFSGE
jgi:hypothetical protein